VLRLTSKELNLSSGWGDTLKFLVDLKQVTEDAGLSSVELPESPELALQNAEFILFLNIRLPFNLKG